MHETSQKTPDFTLPSDDGPEITLSNLEGNVVVLFFYPRDNTSGCTTEARDFSQNLEAFHAAGAQVFGISKDTVSSHAKFRAKHGLTVPLLSDVDHDTCERFGVWKEKKMYGKTFMGIERTTVLIDVDGQIAKVWPKVKVAGHVDDVLTRIKAL